MPSTLITTDQVREHVETGISDDALDRLITAADEDIVGVAGPHDPDDTMQVRVEAHPHRIYLPRRASIIDTLEDSYDGQNWQERGSATFELLNGGRMIQTLSIAFRPRARVTFTPIATNPKRIAALIQLVRLANAHSAYTSESDDTYNVAMIDHGKERSRILRNLRPRYAGGGLLR